MLGSDFHVWMVGEALRLAAPAMHGRDEEILERVPV